MKCKKISEKFFVSMISCMMVFTAFACSNGEGGEIKMFSYWKVRRLR